MEIKDGAASDDGNSNSSSLLLPTSSFSLLPNVGTLTNVRQRNDIMVGGTFDVNTEALIAREIEKRKIKEELLTFGHLKRRREIELEAINELILEKELSQRHQGVSMINSYLHSLQQTELSLANLLKGGINHLDGGIDRTVPLENRVDNVINGVLPYGTCLDDLVGGRMSLGIQSGSNSSSLPFQRQPGVASGVVCKPIIDLRKTVSQPKPETATSKRKFETPMIDGDDAAGVVNSKRQKTQLGWSCELCKLKATSEQALKEHLNGKKHKAKARTAQIITTSWANPSNKTDESSELVLPSGSKSTTPINIVCGDEGVKNVELPNGPLSEEKKENQEHENVDTYFEYWCKMCEVGTMDEAAMMAHRAGEKHLSLLNKKGGGVIAIKNMPDDVKYVDSNRE